MEDPEKIAKEKKVTYYLYIHMIKEIKKIKKSRHKNNNGKCMNLIRKKNNDLVVETIDGHCAPYDIIKYGIVVGYCRQ